MNQKPSEIKTDLIAQAIFTVNRHAKTAPNPKFLYMLKKKAIEKLINKGKAKKVGLHYSANPNNSLQQSDVLVQIEKYFFHLPPSKDDFLHLPHLGNLSEDYRNPKTKMSLNAAKKILMDYLNISNQDQNKPSSPQKKLQRPVFKKLGESYF